MTDVIRTAEKRAPWWIRLWVRLTSRRATPAEIAAEEVTQEEMDRMTPKLLKRMEELRK